MAPRTAPFGTWKSPISTEAITNFVRFRDVIVDPVKSKVYHIESRPREGSRNVLVETVSGKDVVGRKWNVRTRVQEFGGGAAIVHNDVAYFSNYDDNRVYRVKIGSEPEAITPENKAHRFADFDICPEHPNMMVAILEDHTHGDEPSKVKTILCVINIEKKSCSQLTAGADFYARPKFSPDGRYMAWQEWYFPDMPWQGCEAHVAEVAKEGDRVVLKNGIRVAGERKKISAGYPGWANRNTMIFTSDQSGYQNPYLFNMSEKKAKPILQSPIHADFAEPMWLLSYNPQTAIDEKGTMGAFCAFRNGRNVIYLLDLEGKRKPQLIESSFVSSGHFRTLSRHGQKREFVFIGGQLDRKASITKCSIVDRNPGKEEFEVELEILRTSEPGAPFVDYVSSPMPMSISSEELQLKNTKGPLHMILFLPYNPDYIGSSILNEKPPCVVNVHSGPTDVCKEEVEWTKQYFTSRGWAWLDVNYGGSSDYGRHYMDRLNNKWGIVDVEDCRETARRLASDPNLIPGIDMERLVIRGRSAGGFTALSALCTGSESQRKMFAAATSLSGISDLKTMYEKTQKFESRYLDSLLGGSPHDKPKVYEDRSPLNHADKIQRPVLFLQGKLDEIVPLRNTERMVDEIKKRGGIAWLDVFDNEGHGWCHEETMRKALEREHQFYVHVLKIKREE